MKLIYTLVLCLANIICTAQDTLFYTDGQKEIVEIIKQNELKVYFRPLHSKSENYFGIFKNKLIRYGTFNSRENYAEKIDTNSIKKSEMTDNIYPKKNKKTSIEKITISTGSNQSIASQVTGNSAINFYKPGFSANLGFDTFDSSNTFGLGINLNYLELPASISQSYNGISRFDSLNSVLRSNELYIRGISLSAGPRYNLNYNKLSICFQGDFGFYFNTYTFRQVNIVDNTTSKLNFNWIYQQKITFSHVIDKKTSLFMSFNYTYISGLNGLKIDYVEDANQFVKLNKSIGNSNSNIYLSSLGFQFGIFMYL